MKVSLKVSFKVSFETIHNLLNFIKYFFLKMKMKHFHSRKLGKCKNYREESKTHPLFHLGKINANIEIFSHFVIYLFNEFQTYHL